MKKEYRHIHEYSGEGPTVVLLHGLLASAKYWRSARKKLTASGYRVITIDLLGFGRAAKLPTSRYGYDEHVDHVRKAIESITDSEPVILVGHSLGGLVAMNLARRYPELVSRLIVLNAPFYREGEQARETILNTGPLYRFLLTSRFRHAGWAAARIAAFPVWGQHSPQAREGAIEQVIFQGKGLEDLQRITTKTLVITGQKDRSVYIDNLQTTNLPASVAIIVAPSGHHLPIRKPAYVNWVVSQAISVGS